MENQLTSVERISSYTHLPSEPGYATALSLALMPDRNDRTNRTQAGGVVDSVLPLSSADDDTESGSCADKGKKSTKFDKESTVKSQQSIQVATVTALYPV